MYNKLKYDIIGIAISTLGYFLIVYFYDWKLALAIALCIGGNNIERKIVK